jgi:hypothetical protein
MPWHADQGIFVPDSKAISDPQTIREQIVWQSERANALHLELSNGEIKIR